MLTLIRVLDLGLRFPTFLAPVSGPRSAPQVAVGENRAPDAAQASEAAEKRAAQLAAGTFGKSYLLPPVEHEVSTLLIKVLIFKYVKL